MRRDAGKRLGKFSDLDEDKLPFIADDIQAEAVEYAYVRRPIAKGVANHLSRWPNVLSSLFVIACLVMFLVMISFTFAMFVTTIFCSPALKYKWYYSLSDFCRKERKNRLIKANSETYIEAKVAKAMIVSANWKTLFKTSELLTFTS